MDGQGPAARVCYPEGMTVDASGHIVVVDSGAHALRRVSKAGKVSTLAGVADGQDQRASTTRGLARDKDGSILVADWGNNAVLRCAVVARDAMRGPMRCTVRGLVAMQWAPLHGMRCADPCAASWLQLQAQAVPCF